MSKETIFPVVIAKEGKWYTAVCPSLDIATQGRSEKEARKMIADLIKTYMSDPDTRKPTMSDIATISLTNVSVRL